MRLDDEQSGIEEGGDDLGEDYFECNFTRYNKETEKREKIEKKESNRVRTKKGGKTVILPESAEEFEKLLTNSSTEKESEYLKRVSRLNHLSPSSMVAAFFSIIVEKMYIEVSASAFFLYSNVSSSKKTPSAENNLPAQSSCPISFLSTKQSNELLEMYTKCAMELIQFQTLSCASILKQQIQDISKRVLFQR